MKFRGQFSKGNGTRLMVILGLIWLSDGDMKRSVGRNNFPCPFAHGLLISPCAEDHFTFKSKIRSTYQGKDLLLLHRSLFNLLTYLPFSNSLPAHNHPHNHPRIPEFSSSPSPLSTTTLSFLPPNYQLQHPRLFFRALPSSQRLRTIPQDPHASALS